MDQTRHDQFVELFVRNQNRVYRYILTLVPHRADAEELFQQTSLTLWKVWDRFDPTQDFVRWATGIAHNHLRNYWRERQADRLLLSEELLDQLAELRLDRDEALEDRRRALAGCLEKLTDGERALVDECYGGAGTIRAAAEDRGRNPTAIYKALRRIRTALHDCINRTLALEAES